jgi:hypothetical protein
VRIENYLNIYESQMYPEDQVIMLAADTNNNDGKQVTTVLHIIGRGRDDLYLVERTTTIVNNIIKERYNIKEIATNLHLDVNEIYGFEGEIKWKT